MDGIWDLIESVSEGFPTAFSSAGVSYILDYSRTWAYCACSRCGWGLFGHFYSPLSFLSSFSLSLGDDID